MSFATAQVPSQHNPPFGVCQHLERPGLPSSPFLQFYPLMCLQAAAKVPLCSDFCWINSSYICSFSLLFFHCFIMSVKITHWTETECLLVYINSLCSPKSWNSFRYKKLGRPQPQSGRYVKKEMEDSGSKSTASKYFFGLILFILTEIG